MRYIDYSMTNESFGSADIPTNELVEKEQTQADVTQELSETSESVDAQKAGLMKVLDALEADHDFECPLPVQNQLLAKMQDFEEEYEMPFTELTIEEQLMTVEDLLSECEPEKSEGVLENSKINIAQKNEEKIEQELKNKKTIDNEELAFTEVMDNIGNVEGGATLNDYRNIHFPQAMALATEANGWSDEFQDKIKTEYLDKELDRREAELAEVASVFTPEQQQQIFGGDLQNNAKLNLGGGSQYEVYKPLFDQIDAGELSDDDKKKLKEQVSEKLGIKLTGKPENAAQLKSQISMLEEAEAEGRTDEQGNPIKFEKATAITLNESPQVIAYPNPTGASDYIAEGRVDGSDPIYLEFDRQDSEEEINSGINQQLYRSVMGNSDLSGIMEAMLGTGADATGTVSEKTETDALGNDDHMEALLQMDLGMNFVLHGRFLNMDEINQIKDNARWKVPGGDFGGFNAIDPQGQAALMRGLGFDKGGEGQQNMRRAGDLYRGDTGSPSYEELYNLMYPGDKDNDYERLRGIVGDKTFKRLELGGIEGGNLEA